MHASLFVFFFDAQVGGWESQIAKDVHENNRWVKAYYISKFSFFNIINVMTLIILQKQTSWGLMKLAEFGEMKYSLPPKLTYFLP